MMRHNFRLASNTGTIARKPTYAGGEDFKEESDRLVQDYPSRSYRDDKTPLCWLLSQPTPKPNMLIADASFLDGHILVCTYLPNLFRFVCTLRSANLALKELKPIVVLCPNQLSDHDYESLSRFPQLFFMIGDPRVRRDLELACIEMADKVVITNMSQGSRDAGAAGNDDFFDNSAM
ncbi:hypothetical protein BC831DRAFT_12823 [Entophlyctis helioformis]|nr:hypothetical protein BC831DRAFT_12823 [Entophlyctis helioformis]